MASGSPSNYAPTASVPKPCGSTAKTVKGYAKSDFAQVWPRYVSRSDFDALLAAVTAVSS
jgi:hypothetical protein